MKRVRPPKTLSVLVEWCWLTHNIEDHHLSTLSRIFFEQLNQKYSGQSGNKRLALQQIESDMRIVFRKLTYGGRRPTEVSRSRREWLAQQLCLLSHIPTSSLSH